MAIYVLYSNQHKFLFINFYYFYSIFEIELKCLKLTLSSFDYKYSNVFLGGMRAGGWGSNVILVYFILSKSDLFF